MQISVGLDAGERGAVEPRQGGHRPGDTGSDDFEAIEHREWLLASEESVIVRLQVGVPGGASNSRPVDMRVCWTYPSDMIQQRSE